MEREQADAIISLSRLPDWKHLMDYVSGAVRELEHNLGYTDPTASIEIARAQGARSALVNFLRLEESALSMGDNDE